MKKKVGSLGSFSEQCMGPTIFSLDLESWKPFWDPEQKGKGWKHLHDKLIIPH